MNDPLNKSKQELLEYFYISMTKIRRIVDQASNVSVEDKVATMLQMQALTYLKEHPSSTVGQLGQQLLMSSSAIAQLTDRLVNSNSIIRVNDETDRRIVHLKLTPQGRRELADMHKRMLEKMSKFVSHISDEDLHTLVNIMSKLLISLEGK